MGSGLVLCKYVLQDGLWNFLHFITLPCSLYSPMEKILNLKPNVNSPPPPALDTLALVAAILFFRQEDHYTGNNKATVFNVPQKAAACLLAQQPTLRGRTLVLEAARQWIFAVRIVPYILKHTWGAYCVLCTKFVQDHWGNDTKDIRTYPHPSSGPPQAVALPWVWVWSTHGWAKHASVIWQARCWLTYLCVSWTAKCAYPR